MRPYSCRLKLAVSEAACRYCSNFSAALELPDEQYVGEAFDSSPEVLLAVGGHRVLDPEIGFGLVGNYWEI